ncbi:hypothetical protein FGO68_gene10283 [Halteria grandinella]|uniref:Uncharacterized protein n=1 Tax=Halteria grandinella TaxID=5974 RepID=A0A8J8TA54_HALGN|nr:hypothetical protein FGO68_gene10283 [Halteria grandinella]
MNGFLYIIRPKVMLKQTNRYIFASAQKDTMFAAHFNQGNNLTLQQSHGIGFRLIAQCIPRLQYMLIKSQIRYRILLCNLLQGRMRYSLTQCLSLTVEIQSLISQLAGTNSMESGLASILLHPQNCSTISPTWEDSPFPQTRQYRSLPIA